MMRVVRSTIATASIVLASQTVWADDPASLYMVRPAGYGAVGLSLNAQQQSQTDTARFTGVFDSTDATRYRFEHQDAILSGNLGVGYGLELFLDVPNVVRDQVSHDGFRTNGPTGFGDAAFGFKYRLLGDAQSADRLVLRGTFTHHNSIVETDELALYYAHVFSPQLSLGLQTFYEYEDNATQFGETYRTAQFGGSTLLFWNVAPSLTLIPLARIYSTQGYLNVPSNVTTEIGAQLAYFFLPAWSLTPTLTYLHTSDSHVVVNTFFTYDYGVRQGALASLLLQYQF